jgi:hypothetical protein
MLKGVVSMKKKFALNALLVMIVLTILGLIFIFSSGTIGQNMGSNAIANNGGSMDTNTYERIIDSTTTSFQIGGVILSLIGGYGILLCGYALYKEL